MDALTGSLHAADATPLPATAHAPAQTKTPGLAAPALLTYDYGAEMEGALDANVWTLTTAPGVNTTFPNSTVAFQRAPATFGDWEPLAVLTARPRLNFTALAGTEAAWRITLGAQHQQALVYLQLLDGDADRAFEITCALADDGLHWNCHFTVRRSSDQAYLWWGPAISVTPVSQTPLMLGEYHTLALRYDGGQQVTWLIDDEVVLTRDFGGWIDPTELRSGASATSVWNGLDWLTLRYQVLAYPRLGLPTVLDAAIGYLRMSNANDLAASNLTTSGAPRDAWTNETALTVSGGDDGAGFQCLRLAWDGDAAHDYPCYTGAVTTTTIPAAGAHTLTVRGWDWAGNETTANYTYSLLPAPALDAPPAASDGSTYTAAWTDVSGGGAQYEVEQASDAAFTTPRSSGWLNASHYPFSGLTNCQTYYYRLRSRDGQGVISAWSAVVASMQDFARPTASPVSMAARPTPTRPR